MGGRSSGYGIGILFLCITDVLKKYAWFVPDKKGITNTVSLAVNQNMDWQRLWNLQ